MLKLSLPPFRSYLVAWADGPFEHLTSEYKSPLTGKTVPLRIYATPEYIHQAQFALDVKRKVLPVYEQVFDVAYPLPKLDTLVASDFDAGAMENWGECGTFRVIGGCEKAELINASPSLQVSSLAARACSCTMRRRAAFAERRRPPVCR